jgi:hypothetical protein
MLPSGFATTAFAHDDLEFTDRSFSMTSAAVGFWLVTDGHKPNKQQMQSPIPLQLQHGHRSGSNTLSQLHVGMFSTAEEAGRMGVDAWS